MALGWRELASAPLRRPFAPEFRFRSGISSLPVVVALVPTVAVVLVPVVIGPMFPAKTAAVVRQRKPPLLPHSEQPTP